jgi:predicted nucleic acid-binding protein
VSDAGVGVVYVDTSALVKLVVREPESEALDRKLTAWGGLATSMITSIELQRAVGRARAEERESVADDEAVAVLLGTVAEIPLTARVRSTAKTLAPIELRTLDAIHLASALALHDDLAGVLTYDQRMATVATARGLRVIAPT